jgi:hypothetical protein
VAKLSRGLAAGAISLILAGQASATVVRDPKQANSSDAGVEEGGHRLSEKERKQVACTQFANPIMGMSGMTPWGAGWGTPWGFWPGMLPSRNGRMMMAPMTDGGVACIVKPNR